MDDESDHTKDRADPQHDGEPVSDFLKEANPSGGFLLFWKLVVTFLQISSGGCFSCQTSLEVSSESIAELLHGDLVLVHSLNFSCFLVHLAGLSFFLIARSL